MGCSESSGFGLGIQLAPLAFDSSGIVEDFCMAIATLTYTEAQGGTPIIVGVAGKAILVTRVLFSCANGLSVALFSDPLGGIERVLLPAIYAAAGEVVQLELGRDFGLPADVGKSVGLVSAFA